MSSIGSLRPHERAAFATTSRLVACLITESLLKALFVPIRSSREHLAGAAVVLTSSASKRDGLYGSEDVFAVLALHHVPIFKPNSKSEIGLLDSLDMLPCVYELVEKKNGNVDSMTNRDDLSATILPALSQACIGDKNASLTVSLDPLHIWKKYADALDIDEDMQDAVAAEFSSSFAWQKYSYEHSPPEAPTFESPSIVWEQCVIGGHPLHPMHKARRTIAPIPPIEPGAYNWQRPHIRLVTVPRARMRIEGAWDDLLAPLRERAAVNAGKPLNVPDHRVLVPVHDLQVPNIREKFPEAHVLPEEYHVEALAQLSIRSVLVPSALRDFSLKLPLGVRITSAMRTISPPAAYLGPRFSRVIIPLLTYDRSLLIVEREPASVSHVDPDHEVAKHLAGIVREAYENTSTEERDERVIVCTALTETGYGGIDEVPLVQTVFGLDTEEKRVAWLDRYVELFLKAFLPPVIANGVTFESHAQNTLARFDVRTRALTGFVIRDFGGIRVHTPTLCASTGLRDINSAVAPGHSILADKLEDVYTRLYHTLVHNHLQQLIRVLGLHYNGRGWGILRHHLGEQIPEGHELHKLWLSPETRTVPGKCLMRMRLQGMYRTHLHGPFPNLIHYEGDGSHRKECSA